MTFENSSTVSVENPFFPGRKQSLKGTCLIKHGQVTLVAGLAPSLKSTGSGYVHVAATCVLCTPPAAPSQGEVRAVEAPGKD